MIRRTFSAGNFKVAMLAAALAASVATIAAEERFSPDISLLFTPQATARTADGTLATTQVDNLRLDATVKWLGPSSQGALIVYNGSSARTGWGILELGSADTPPNSLAVLAGGVTIVTSPLTLTAGKWQHVRMDRVNQSVTLTLNPAEDDQDDWHQQEAPQTYSFGVVPANPVGGTWLSIEQTIVGDAFNGYVENAGIKSLATPKPTLIESWTFDHGTRADHVLFFGTSFAGVKGNVLNMQGISWAFSQDEHRGW